MTPPLLSVRNLTAVLQTRRGEVPIVRDVSFDVAPGEVVGIVGESGSGKTMTVLSLLGLLPQQVRVASGSVRFRDTELAGAPEDVLRALRGPELAMIFQDPSVALNPLQRVGDQVAEGLVVRGAPLAQARKRAIEALERVRIPSPERVALSYPHELSGGMRQRVMIASALVLSPSLLIADEATSSLDVTIQQQILNLVAELQREMDTAVIWITHDMGVVARLVERVLVMYGGRLVEEGPTARVFAAPEHPYTHALLGALPSLEDAERRALAQIGGTPPDFEAMPPGCPYVPRCPYAIETCSEMPPLTERATGGRAACWVPPSHWSDACSA